MVRRYAGLRCSHLLQNLGNGAPGPRAALVGTYGSAALAEERRLAYSEAVERFLKLGGDRRVRVFRAPGRIALNPHCEHQGAWVPYGTHRREILLVVGARSDDLFTLSNLDPSHRQAISFRLHEEVARGPKAWRRGWLAYIEDPCVVSTREALADPKHRLTGRTSSINFVKAAALRLLREGPGRPCGADMVINGDIPVGVGQSSSSALVVATAMSLNELWGLKLTPEALTSACGEAEWYVGTRGGAGDHAAMLLGSASGLVGIRFEPPVTVRDVRPMPLPAGYQIIIANSGRQAIKNKEERRQFNGGIFAYQFALMYLREALQRQARELGLALGQEGVRFLADINAERFPLHAIYRLLLAVPELVTPHELRLRYPESYETGALGCFGTTDPEKLPQSIPVRGAALYGLGRVDRGLAMHEICARGDEAAMRESGRLMYLTHDGDRVSRYDRRDGRSVPYQGNLASVSDEHIRSLAEAAAGGPGAPGWQASQLRFQSGFFGASTPELDRIVDLVTPLPEVLGAGLMGAGGGGCVLILARAGQEALARVTGTLRASYYEPLGLPVAVEAWHPTAPAGELTFDAAAVEQPGLEPVLAEEKAATWLAA